MTRQHHSPNSRGAQQRAQVSMMACPWSEVVNDEGEHVHPFGAPSCQLIPGNLKLGKVVPTGHLMMWLSHIMTNVATVVDALWNLHIEAGDFPDMPSQLEGQEEFDLEDPAVIVEGEIEGDEAEEEDDADQSNGAEGDPSSGIDVPGS